MKDLTRLFRKALAPIKKTFQIFGFKIWCTEVVELEPPVFNEEGKTIITTRNFWGKEWEDKK